MVPPTSIWTGAVYRVGVAGHGTPDMGILEQVPLCSDLGETDDWLGPGDVIVHQMCIPKFKAGKNQHVYNLVIKKAGTALIFIRVCCSSILIVAKLPPVYY